MGWGWAEPRLRPIADPGREMPVELVEDGKARRGIGAGGAQAKANCGVGCDEGAGRQFRDEPGQADRAAEPTASAAGADRRDGGW